MHPSQVQLEKPMFFLQNLRRFKHWVAQWPFYRIRYLRDVVMFRDVGRRGWLGGNFSSCFAGKNVVLHGVFNGNKNKHLRNKLVQCFFANENMGV